MQGVQWNCKEGEHSDLATLFWSIPDDLLSRLFSVGHEADGSRTVVDETGFKQGSLALYSVIYISMLALCAGVCVPAGMFMPAVMLGAASGLGAGVQLQHIMPGYHIQPGVCYSIHTSVRFLMLLMTSRFWNPGALRCLLSCVLLLAGSVYYSHISLLRTLLLS